MSDDANKINALEMSDEDFLKLGSAPVEEPEVDTSGSDTVEDDNDQTEKVNEVVKEDEKSSQEQTNQKVEDETSVDEKKTEEIDNDSKTETDSKKEDVSKKSSETEVKTFSVPTSFQANGKTIELRDEAEALALMQMGANYTRKMQELAPNRKILMMLRNNNLLDEGNLSYLIDIHKKDPKAIKKLIKDSGIDPLEIDTSEDPNYIPGGHTITDEEVNFRTVVDDLISTTAGEESINLINSRLDRTSRNVLWKSPEILKVLHEQRESGVYDVIVNEMDRRITLGIIPANTPFVEAYKIVGDDLVKQVSQNKTNSSTAGNIVETRVGAPKQQVQDNDKVKAASTSRSSTNPVKEVKNPLAMSDDDFLKTFANRV